MNKNNKKDEYYRIYNYRNKGNTDYEIVDENEDPEEVIEKLKGTIGRGDCIYCYAKNGMKYDGLICFICSECGNSVHEDIYYRWAAGYPINFE